MKNLTVKNFSYKPGVLTIEFQNKRKYNYYFAPKWMLGALVTAKSQEQFISRFIKRLPSKEV